MEKIVENFDLLSIKTKNRIKDLIDKRLTPQTINLFAGEYESYDIDVRIQINLYIKHLFDLEYQNFLSKISDANSNNQNRNNSTFNFNRRYFEDRQNNIKALQNILQNKESILTNSFIKTTDLSVQKTVEPKLDISQNSQTLNNTKVEKSSKLEKMLKEAQRREREETEKKALQIREAKKVVNKKEKKTKTFSETTSNKQTKIKKPENKDSGSIKNLNSSKTNDQFVELLPKQKPDKTFSQVKTRQISDEEYAREQVEKENLRKRLFGNNSNTKKEDLNSKEDQTVNKIENKQFDPNVFDRESINMFHILGTKITLFEISETSSRNLMFWNKIRQKYRVNSLPVFFRDNANDRVKRKILKLRSKFMKKNNLTEADVDGTPKKVEKTKKKK